MSAPNQKNIELQKEDKHTANNYLAIRTQKAERLAAKTLTPTAFKIWLYVTANKNGYTFDLSSADVADSYGISRRSYTDAMKELERLGYLVPKVKGKERFYTFYDVPPEPVITITLNKTQ